MTTGREHRNRDAWAFAWKATADDIVAKVQRRRRDTLRQIKTQTDR
jgi:hypothetical protein